jgi:Icc-related predicted phosphoesterase
MSTRLFFATDIHGSETCFLKFFNAASFYDAQVLVMGGDITGKMVVPIIKGPRGRARATFLGRKRRLRSQADIDRLSKLISRSGGYPLVCSQEEYDEIYADEERRDEVFNSLMRAQLVRLLDRAEAKLSESGVRCYITPGNDDRFIVDQVFEGREWVINPEGKIVEIDEHHEMISTGFSNITPWHCPRDIPEEALWDKIAQMADELQDPGQAIFSLHCPPFGTSIDEAPELDENLQPVLVAGNIHMVPVGSTAVRRAIEEYQPLAGLHGHIHESRGRAVIGSTPCFNPGSQYQDGYLRGLILDLGPDGIEGYHFTSG